MNTRIYKQKKWSEKEGKQSKLRMGTKKGKAKGEKYKMLKRNKAKRKIRRKWWISREYRKDYKMKEYKIT